MYSAILMNNITVCYYTLLCIFFPVYIITSDLLSLINEFDCIIDENDVLCL